MTFELEADGVRFWCSSPKWTRKLVEKGARLVDAAQAEYLRGEVDAMTARHGLPRGASLPLGPDMRSRMQQQHQESPEWVRDAIDAAAIALVVFAMLLVVVLRG